MYGWQAGSWKAFLLKVRIESIHNFDDFFSDHTECHAEQFQCLNYRCISYEYVCDGDNDCRDNSDEVKNLLLFSLRQ